MELTPHQEKGFFAIIEAILDSNEHIVTLNGPAGTGKTFLATRILDYLKSHHQIVMTAPTHKATEVLRKMYGDAFGEGFMTTHSALGLRLVRDGKGGYECRPDPKARPAAAIIGIDEGSMCGTTMTARMDELHEDYGTRFFAIGDTAQLPPVGEKPSRILSRPVFTLEEIIRQKADSGILAMATEVREGRKPTLTNRHDTRVYRNATRWFDAAEIALGMSKDPDDIRILTHRNATKDSYNSELRSRDGKELPFEEGEWIMFNDEYDNRGVKYRNNSQYIIKAVNAGVVSTSDPDQKAITFSEIMSWDTIWEDKQLSWDVWELTLEGAWGDPVPVLMEHERIRFNEVCGRLAQKARKSRNWRAFYNMIERFANVSHVQALTVHRSQGSTYKEVFLDLRDIARAPNHKRQLFYVGLTRASEKVHLLV